MATFLMILAAYIAGGAVMRMNMNARFRLERQQYQAAAGFLISRERAEARRWSHLDD